MVTKEKIVEKIAKKKMVKFVSQHLFFSRHVMTKMQSVTSWSEKNKNKNKKWYDGMTCYSTSYSLGTSYIHVIIFKLGII
jgi:uncharacterized membrane protein YkgB